MKLGAPLTNATFGHGARILVVGLGRSGRTSLEILVARGAQMFATDESPQALEAYREEAVREGVTLLSPAELAAHIGTLDVAVLSPGIPLTSNVVRDLQKAEIPVLSEIEVAYRIAKAPLIAITGTKGKTTTTALTGALLRRAGYETYVGGNIGNPLIAETAIASAKAWVVAEVSSFQLETIHTFHPRIAAVLNLSPDHLDRYGSMASYVAAKYRIFSQQTSSDFFVGNLDDPLVALLADAAAPSRPVAKAQWFSLNADPRAALCVRDERIFWVPHVQSQSPIEIMPVAEIPLLGRHNVANVLAALLMGLLAGADPEKLRRGVRDFQGLPHRLELVATLAGIRYIDDSKATNPGSVAAALLAVSEPIVLIAGGKKKGTDFSELGKLISDRARAVVFIGESAQEMAATVTAIPVHRASSMDDAVIQATALACSGDTVLLSPGCASFDMFESAEARGDAFAAAVTLHGGLVS